MLAMFTIVIAAIENGTKTDTSTLYFWFVGVKLVAVMFTYCIAAFWGKKNERSQRMQILQMS